MSSRDDNLKYGISHNRGINRIGFSNLGSFRKYPFYDNTSLVDDNGRMFPTNIISGILLIYSVPWFFKDELVFVSKVSIHRHIASIVISAIYNDSVVDLAVANANMESSMPFSSVQLHGVDGISAGNMEFGSFDPIIQTPAYLQSGSITYSFSSPNQTRILDSCVFRRPATGFESTIYDDISATSVSGDVMFYTHGCHASIAPDVKTGEDTVHINHDADISRICPKLSLRDEMPIKSINGIQPGKDGAIIVRFV